MSAAHDPAHEAARLTRRRGLWLAGLLGVAALLVGCAFVTPFDRADLPPPPQPRDTTTSALASQVRVVGRSGRLGPAQRAQLFARLARQGEASALNRHLAVASAIDERDVYAQTDARLLIDGPATFKAMFDAIAAARQTILLQSYSIDDSAIADRLVGALLARRAAGVQVLVLYDALGSLGIGPDFADALNAAGIPTCAINPVNPLERPGYWGISHRDHRKILSVDRSIGFTGGINVTAVYSSGSFGRNRRATVGTESGWRDTQIRLHGPAVAALDDLVRETWIRQGCQGAVPALPAAATGPAATGATGSGPQLVRIVASHPHDEANRIYTMLLTALDAAQHSIYLTMAYFAPGPDMIDALCEAAERGVDVHLVLPSLSDFRPVLYAGRSHYDRLLAAGVKIHELRDAVLHAKTAVIDGVVSTVGSSNMDWRSLVQNSEVNAMVYGEAFGDAMTRMFRADVAASAAITLAAWRERPLADRALEGVARLFEGFW
jgi:cardiolipin synthase